MRLLMLDLLACPECRRAPLHLTEIESSKREVRSTRRCVDVCGRTYHSPLSDCRACLSHDVEVGYLRCPGCERFYFIEHGIPVLLGDGFASMIDRSFPARYADALGDDAAAISRYLSTIADASPNARDQWNIDDVRYWEENVYGDVVERQAIFDRTSRARPDAGNRTYPRERTLFRHIRPEIKGLIMVDLGCGISHTVRTLCEPAREEYVYVGIELSRSAMLVNRQTLEGDFIVASVDALPLRESSVDVAVMLGTLHHLAEHRSTLDRIVETVRPGGLVAMDEVIARYGLKEQISRLLQRRSLVPDESAHNESVDPDLIIERLTARGSIVAQRREYSLVRGVITAWFSEAMRSRPWLTRLVLGVDAVVLTTIGRWVKPFGPRQILVLARKDESTSVAPATPKGAPSRQAPFVPAGSRRQDPLQR